MSHILNTHQHPTRFQPIPKNKISVHIDTLFYHMNAQKKKLLHLFLWWYAYELLRSQDSSDSRVPKLQTGQHRNGGLIPRRGKRIFSSQKHPKWLWRPQKYPILWVLGESFFRCKAAGHKVDGTSSYWAEVRNELSHNFTDMWTGYFFLVYS